MKIEAGDIATLQRNLVLSHAAGVGEPTPPRIRAADDGAEACKPGAERLRRIEWRRLELLEAMLSRDVLPVVPSRGPPARPRPRPFAHMTAVMPGVGRRDIEGQGRSGLRMR